MYSTYRKKHEEVENGVHERALVIGKEVLLRLSD